MHAYNYVVTHTIQSSIYAWHSCVELIKQPFSKHNDMFMINMHGVIVLWRLELR